MIPQAVFLLAQLGSCVAFGLSGPMFRLHYWLRRDKAVWMPHPAALSLITLMLYSCFAPQWFLLTLCAPLITSCVLIVIRKTLRPSTFRGLLFCVALVCLMYAHLWLPLQNVLLLVALMAFMLLSLASLTYSLPPAIPNVKGLMWLWPQVQAMFVVALECVAFFSAQTLGAPWPLLSVGFG